jgi:hypothetical protein
MKFRSQVKEGGEGEGKREESGMYKERTDFISASSFSVAFKTSPRGMPDVAFHGHCGVIVKCVLVKARPFDCFTIKSLPSLLD